MVNINFKKYNFKITSANDVPYIFDEVRKKNVKLTPEEWVRQNLVHYLIYDLAYPKTKIAIEKEFDLNGLKKRFDILVFDKNTEVFLLIECKSQKENLSEQVVAQNLSYNLKLKVPFICISNGRYTHAWDLRNTIPKELDALPKYQ